MTKKLASIYPLPLSADRPIYGGQFRIPAVAKTDKPFLLTIPDHYQMETQPWFKGTTFGGKQKQERIQILGEHIAIDLLTDWTRSTPGMDPQCGPGVWLVRDIVHLTDDEGRPLVDAEGKQQTRPATDEEAKRMFAEDHEAARERQAAWGERCTQKGDVMGEDPKQVPYIPGYCRVLSAHYGHDRKWQRNLRDGDIKSCPFCTKTIAATAAKCPNCNEVVDRKRYDELKKAPAAA